MSEQPTPLRIAETLPACTHPRHPDDCPPFGYLTTADGAKIPLSKTVYAWDSGRHYNPDDKAAVTAMSGLLWAHGIEPTAFVIGNELVVDARCDGTLWLKTWRAVGNVPLADAPMCKHCPGCVEQERVVVPMVAPVPLLPGAYLSDRVTVPTAQVEAVA